MRAHTPCSACGHRCDEHAWSAPDPDFGACPPSAVAHSHDTWGTQRIEHFDVNGTLYSVEQVVRALHLAHERPARRDDLANSAGYLYDPGWQDALAEVRLFSEERLGDLPDGTMP